ncbi:MAG: glycosyltransferase family 2 protein [Pseudomonadota bacterium]
MNTARLRLPDLHAAAPAEETPPIGRYLVDEGLIDQESLVNALDHQRRIDAPLGEILIADGLITRAQFMAALASCYQVTRVDLDADPPELSMTQNLPASLCLSHQIAPWTHVGGTLLVATSRPDRFDKVRACMGVEGARMLPVVADEVQIQSQLSRLYGEAFVQKAATRVPAAESCRAWQFDPERRMGWALAVLALLAILAFVAPLTLLSAFILWALFTLVLTTALKAWALWVQFPHRTEPVGPPPDIARPAFRLPRVSIMVPLLNEHEIADALISRLTRLTYPKSLLNVVLVLEEGDDVTRTTLERTALPYWISVIEVPEGNQLKTKPRALNYALDFCKGSIIGVWDAEDAPEPDQIEKVVTRFQEAPAHVACLQGMLDYYNARTNWLSRCFTIEYATWWRLVLPGVARLGLVVPLGGTTLFFRREALQKLGGWDAHNVTEDADLGLRLARHGYTTELLGTATFEEANCRTWPWVRQRSRWLKGFLVTWCVHMRAPRMLLRDLGWRRFIGVQVLFLATFSQFLLAPLLWSFWLTLFGMPHPVALTLGPVAMWTVIAVFVLAEAINLALAFAAVSGPRHRHLLKWVVTTPVYFALGALAALKALREFVVSPFFWDKTQHGFAGEDAATLPPPAAQHHV